MFRKSIFFVLKTILLTIWLTVLFMVGSGLMGPSAEGMQLSPEEQNFAGIALIIVSLIDTLILAWLILRSRLHGWRLMLVVMAAYYGVKIVISQLESWYFMSNITPDMLTPLLGDLLGAATRRLEA